MNQYISVKISVLALLNVKYLFKIKLFIVIIKDPRKFETYLLINNFSLQIKVIPKSISIPDNPTERNLMNFKIIRFTNINLFKKYYAIYNN